MAKKTKDEQRSYFYEGAFPTDVQFKDTVDSSLGVLPNVSALPQASSENLGDQYKIGNVFYECKLVSGTYQWVMTATAVPTNNYEDLDNKPTIHNVRITGNISDIDELGGLSKDDTKYAAVESAATSDIVLIKTANGWKKTTIAALFDAYTMSQAMVDFKAAVLQAATDAVTAALGSKLDKDLSNIEYVDSFKGQAVVPIVTDNGTKKTSLNNVTFFVTTQAQAIASASDTSINKYRKILELEGAQDGSNVTYTVVGGYKTGTARLHFNGQLLSSGRDYKENDTETIVFLTYIPEADDVIVFEAIPLE